MFDSLKLKSATIFKHKNINMIQELNYEELSRNNNITVKKGVP